MYETHFGLSGPPFQLSPDPSFYFESRGHSEALAVLRRGLAAAWGFTVLSGEIGAGKTLVVGTLLDGLDRARVRAAQIVNTQLDADELLHAISTAFGVTVAGRCDRAQLRAGLRAQFDNLSDQGCRGLLIVDEAQNLSVEALLLLGELCGQVQEAAAPMQCFLVGQPELRGLLETSPLRPLASRVLGSCHLGPLEGQEIRAYVEHRLRRVRWTGVPSFDPDAFAAIFRATGGVPRLINLLCGRLMLSRFLSAETYIDAQLVEQTGRDLAAEVGMLVPEPATPAAHADSAGVPTPVPVDAPMPAPSERFPPGEGAQADPAVPQPALPSVGDESSRADSLRPAMHVRRQNLRRAPAALPPPAHVVPAPTAGRPPLPAAGERGPLLCVAGGQAEHIKWAALLQALSAHEQLPSPYLVRALRSDALALHQSLFGGLQSANCRFELDVDGASPVAQVAQVMQRLEPIVDEYSPSAVIVIDAEAPALAASLVASAKGVPLVHIGSGLRTFDRQSAREANARAIDHLADLHYAGEPQGAELLGLEGIAAARIVCAGNLQLDALQAALRAAVRQSGTLRPASLENFVQSRHGYGVVSLQRPENVTEARSFISMIAVLQQVSRDLPLVWPMHPRARLHIDRFGLAAMLAGLRIACLPAQPYVEMASLLGNATCVLTDSWAVQEEATALCIPCLTLGRVGARPRTVEEGSNIVIGASATLATRTVWDILYNGGKRGRRPASWDGQSAPRIARHLADWLARAGVTAAPRTEAWPAAVV